MLSLVDDMVYLLLVEESFYMCNWSCKRMALEPAEVRMMWCVEAINSSASFFLWAALEIKNYLWIAFRINFYWSEQIVTFSDFWVFGSGTQFQATCFYSSQWRSVYKFKTLVSWTCHEEHDHCQWSTDCYWFYMGFPRICAISVLLFCYMFLLYAPWYM